VSIRLNDDWISLYDLLIAIWTSVINFTAFHCLGKHIVQWTPIRTDICSIYRKIQSKINFSLRSIISQTVFQYIPIMNVAISQWLIIVWYVLGSLYLIWCFLHLAN
jgi:hypothetical protein